MKLVITGSPGVGKTTVAKILAKRLKLEFFNEKAFALGKGIGKWNLEENELEIPLKKLEKALNSTIKSKKNAIIEGHLLCEIRLKADFVVIIRLHPELLEGRLSIRRYAPEKIQDNVFCEGIDYCKKHSFRNYKKDKIIEVNSQKTARETAELIIKELKEKGAFR